MSAKRRLLIACTLITAIYHFPAYSSLEYKVIDYDKTHELSLIEVKLITGRSHQIRVQFSSRNHPLYADQKYNPTPDFDNIALFAYHLEFFHPTTKQLLVFEENLPNKKPWNYFS